MKKKIILLIVILGAGFYLYSQQQSKSMLETSVNPASEVVEVTQEETNAQILLAADEDGQTALELLTASAAVETKDYGEAGLFVTSINGVAGDNEHYWAFYVNDEYAQQSADQTILKTGDNVKFVYEKVDAAKF